MNKFTKLAAGIALASCGTISTSAFADVSYNIGYASEYYYRGFFQKSSSASAGIDFESGGLYAGGWTADVGDGLEVDGYFGYGFETENGFSAGVGYTGYFYTGDFDDTYQEINLTAGFGIISVEYSVGQYDNFGNGKQDYGFLGLTLEQDGFYGTYGTFDNDFEGSYFEIGYGTTVADIDLGISAIFPDNDITGSGTDQALVFSIGYGF